MHDIDLVDHMMKVLLDINEVSPLNMLIYDLDVKDCSFMIGLLSMCEVMGPYMYIALVELDLGHKLGIISFSVKLNKYLCIMTSSSLYCPFSLLLNMYKLHYSSMMVCVALYRLYVCFLVALR